MKSEKQLKTRLEAKTSTTTGTRSAPDDDPSSDEDSNEPESNASSQSIVLPQVYHNQGPLTCGLNCQGIVIASSVFDRSAAATASDVLQDGDVLTSDDQMNVNDRSNIKRARRKNRN